MTQKPLRLEGEVVETFVREGRSIARIVLRSGCIDVCIDDLEDIHLGDEVVIDLETSVHRVQSKASTEGPVALRDET